MTRLNSQRSPLLPSAVSGRSDAGKVAENGSSGMQTAKPAVPRAPARALIHEFKERVLNVVTPRGQRADSKKLMSREKTRREVGKLLDVLSNPSKNARTDFLVAKETISGLTGTMQPMTSRGVNYEEEFRDCVKANLKHMSTEDIVKLHDSLAKPREAMRSLDPNHFVLRHFRDIQAVIATELQGRACAEAGKDSSPAAEAAMARQQPEPASQQARVARLHKGANPRLLKPLPRDNLGPASAPKPKAPEAPTKAAAPRRVLQPGRDFNPRLLAKPPKKVPGAT
jgi:hypothetical protein